jgi:hypothetical protein
MHAHAQGTALTLEAAAEFEASLASFVKDKRLYGAAAGVAHFGELAWPAGTGFADITAKRPSRRRRGLGR